MLPKIFIVEDNELNRAAMCAMVSQAGWEPHSFRSCEAFLKAYSPSQQGCLVLDIHLPGMSGLELMDAFGLLDNGPPLVVVSGSSQINEAVQAMKAGASDFILKPFGEDRFVASIRTALGRARHSIKATEHRRAAINHIGHLTDRQRMVMEMVLTGAPSKNIAADLGISQRTVENHRAAIMRKTGAHSQAELYRLVMCNRCSLASSMPSPVH